MISLLCLYRPKRIPVIAELAPGGSAVESPGDFDMVTVHTAVPGAALYPECLEIGDSSTAEALPGKEADLDFAWLSQLPWAGVK